MKKRVADIVIEILVKNNITDCFGVVGGGAMHLDNALALNKKINKVFNHHEQASAMAAEAYARTSGKMAAVCVTSGPGATNAITGVMGAWQDSLPMIVLSGQVRYEISVPKTGLSLRYRGIQEFEIIPTVKNMTKYAVMITDPLSIKKEMQYAIDCALEGRRGPVWIDIPLDIQSAIVEENDLYPTKEYKVKREDVNYAEFEKLIKEAKRPCILTGSAIRSADVVNEFYGFINSLNIPIIGGSYLADSMYMEHDRYYGCAGNIGPRTGNFILQNADLIIALGNSLGYRQTGFNQDGFAPKAKIIMVDAEIDESRKPGLNISLFIHRDLKTFFKEVKKCDLSTDNIGDWFDYCNKLKKRFSPYEGADEINLKDRVNSYYFWKKFSEYEEDDSICALGNNSGNSPKLQIGVKKRDQRVLTNYTCGSMGADIPYAIGAAVASKKKVYCITGDGSMMMNLQELQTIKHYDLPVNVVVFSNEGYAAIRQTTKNFFNGVCIGCTKETGISFPNFADLANTFGFNHIKCRTNEELDEVLQELVNSKERVFVEIDQLLDNPIVPKVMSRMDENGKMLTPALQDMAPFISSEELKELMISED